MFTFIASRNLEKMSRFISNTRSSRMQISGVLPAAGLTLGASEKGLVDRFDWGIHLDWNWIR